MITALIIAGVVIGSLFFLVLLARQRMKSIKDVPDNKKIVILNDQVFDKRIKNGTVLVDFHATWCVPCKMMAPILNDLAEEVKSTVTISKLDVDVARKTASKYSVRSVPTMILFRNGKEIKRITGVKTKEYLLREIDRVVTLN
jgi:thioredoxin 1